jgi:MYXO-CTERM domain-containing protein
VPRFPALLLPWASLLLPWAAGCIDEPSPPVPSSFARPIVDGTRETGERPVVMIYNDAGAGCTASVIAPRVVLTAKHCVLGMSPSGWHVLVGSSVYGAIEEYGVTSTRTTPGSGIEEADIAVMILDRDFRHGFKRWEFTPWPGFHAGSRITAIGFGQTDPSDPGSAGTKYRRDGYVVRLSGALEFITNDENTCQGDSGGPILYEDVVTGIVSRGEAGCRGMGVVTRVSGFADLVIDVLRETGACVPTGLEVCNGVDDDCWNGSDDGLGPACACADGGFPRGETCNGSDDDCNGTIDDLPGCACTGGAPPGTEICNGTDDDCNGVIDEVCAHLGDPCVVDTDCSSGLCLDLGAGLVCTAHCRSGPGTPCPDGGYCDAVACTEGACRPAAAAGGAPLGAGCGSSRDCASGYCAPWIDGGQACARPCAPGALACFADEVCSAIAEGCGVCIPAAAAAGGRSFGEPCVTDADCLSGLCLLDGPAETCGADCRYRYCTMLCASTTECPEGSHCRDGVCARGRLSDAGETCVTGGDCDTGICAVSAGGTTRCVEPCAPDGSCPSGFVCWAENCWPDGVRPGDPCATTADWCAGGECVWIGGTIVCATPCADPGDCPSGLACVAAGDGMSGLCLPGNVSTGGGDGDGDGCNCAVPGASSGAPAGALLALAGLVLLRRRRPS